jgi:hypothetical protein
MVTHGVLPALAVQPLMGRWFSQADDMPGSPETVILTYGYWQRAFGGDKSVVGRAVTVDLRPRQVIGVMPENFRFLRAEPELILPQRFDGNLAQTNSNYSYFGLARLKPGVTLAQANADVARMLPIWDQKGAELLQLGPALRPLKENLVAMSGTFSGY